MAEITSIYGLDVEVIKKLQTKIGVKADGMIGNKTITALQAFLNQNGANIAVDGKLGPKTITALQEYVGAEPDGKFGEKTANALAMKLMENQDGEKIVSSANDLENIFKQQFKDAGLS
jgi:murein L,D-transpeptidase YcbB/YkuD